MRSKPSVTKSNVKHAVHKHEEKMHPGEKKTKLTFGKKK
jgi:hypothetical protein